MMRWSFLIRQKDSIHRMYNQQGRIWHSVTVIIACVALSFCALSSRLAGAQERQDPQKEHETYVMVSFGWGMEFFSWSFAGMYDAAQLLGPHVKVEWQGSEPWDPPLEAKALLDVVERGVDGILVSVADKNIFTPIIDDAVEAGIPVICFDSDAPESQRLATVTTDNYQAGYVAGTTMAKWLNGSGVIGVSTVKNVVHLEERLRGFRAGVANFSPEIQIYLIEDDGFGYPQEKAVYDYKILLKAHPEIKGLFGTWARTGVAAAEAVQNLKLQNQVSILAFDFDAETIQAIEAGKIRATVAQNPYLMGFYGMLLAYSAAHPTSVPARHPDFGHVPTFIDTGVSIVGKEESRQFMQIPKVSVPQEPPLRYKF